MPAGWETADIQKNRVLLRVCILAILLLGGGWLINSCSSTRAENLAAEPAVKDTISNSVKPAEAKDNEMGTKGEDAVYHEFYVEGLAGRPAVVGSEPGATLVLRVDYEKSDTKAREKAAVAGTVIAVGGELGLELSRLQGRRVVVKGTIIPMAKWDRDPERPRLDLYHPHITHVIDVTAYSLKP